MIHATLARLSSLRFLRGALLPILERFNPGDVHIRHHYTGQRLLIHSFRHKGYWFHGWRREKATMQFFQRVTRPGDTVIELGGHVGYVGMLFSQLVGETGRVVVLEPGSNNLPYLRENVAELPNVQIVEAAVSDRDGYAEFFEEALTGQNKSLLGGYQRFEENRRRAFSQQHYRRAQVQTVRMDTLIDQLRIKPDLVKIDIEGAESLALAGAKEILAEHLPVLMVEVTHNRNHVLDSLRNFGYLLFAPEGRRLVEAENLQDNICALHPIKHRKWLEELQWGQELSAA